MDSEKEMLEHSSDLSSLKKAWKQVLSLFLFLLMAWVVAVLCLFFLQRSLLYFPDKTPIGDPSHTGIPGMRTVDLQTRDGLVLKSWYVPPKSNKYPVVVLYHGNSGTIQHRVKKARFLYQYGIGVLLVEYRGFGGNQGKPTEGGLYADGRAAVDFLINRQKIPENRLIIYGESLGTGVAVQMAIEYSEAVLILEAPFRSITALAKQQYSWVPVDALLWDKYENKKKISYIDSAVLILHGTADGTVPYSEGRYLYEAGQEPKAMVAIEGGGHDNLYDYTQTGRSILFFLKRQGVMPASK